MRTATARIIDDESPEGREIMARALIARKIREMGLTAKAVEALPDLLAACEEAERVIRWAAQESAGKVKAEVVGGWLHHADTLRAALARATGGAE